MCHLIENTWRLVGVTSRQNLSCAWEIHRISMSFLLLLPFFFFSLRSITLSLTLSSSSLICEQVHNSFPTNICQVYTCFFPPGDFIIHVLITSPSGWLPALLMCPRLKSLPPQFIPFCRTSPDTPFPQELSPTAPVSSCLRYFTCQSHRI